MSFPQIPAYDMIVAPLPGSIAVELLPLPEHEPRVELNEWFAPNWCPISCET